jgi:class 3 adenylate cyclase
MSDRSLDTLVADDDEVVFAPEDTPEPTTSDDPTREPWKVMVVDDEMEVHNVTRLALDDFRFEGKTLALLNAHSGGEAKQLIERHPDTALILLDVVMEADHAGLEVVEYIRNVLSNDRVRIVLRTGQPGQAPERSVVVNYDINDYKTKTELTTTKLFTTVVTALRSFDHILTIERIAAENAALYANLQAAVQKVELLEKAKSHLSKFVPQSVQRLIDSNPDAPELEKRDQDVSILFLDIACYTQISESLQQEKVNYLIERYFSSFLDDIHQNQGDINETAGDGLMIIFQDPDPTVHAVQAARTALAIHRKTAQINADLRGTYAPVVVNIGINSGRASVGSSKFEGLTGTRWTYTATGPVTNLAARLAAHASDGAVLVSAETAGRIGRRFHLDDLGSQMFKNVSEPMQVFRLLA